MSEVQPVQLVYPLRGRQDEVVAAVRALRKLGVKFVTLAGDTVLPVPAGDSMALMQWDLPAEEVARIRKETEEPCTTQES